MTGLQGVNELNCLKNGNRVTEKRMKMMATPEANCLSMNVFHLILASMLAKQNPMYFLSSWSIPLQIATVLDVTLLEKIRFQTSLAPRFPGATRGIVSSIVA